MHRSRANVYSSCVALTSLLAVAGCAVDTVELLSIEFEKSHADVDVNCADGCAGSDRLEAVIVLEDSAQLPNDAVVEFSGYRIDYDVGAPALEGPAVVTVGKGQSEPFAPIAADNEQRAWAVSQGGSITGTATLTVKGSDHRQKEIVLTARVEIRFADFAATTTASSSSGAGGSGAGGGAGGN